MTLIEACVTSARSAKAAQAAGAGRIELCARISRDGLTPAAGTVAATRAATTLPIHLLVRPHDHGLVYDSAAWRALFVGIAMAHAMRVEGVVVGCLTPRREVDAELLADLIAAARPLRITFHRAFDRVARPRAALETLIDLGVDEVLTSGGPPTATGGTAALKRLVRQAGDRIGIIAAGRVRGTNVRALVAATGVPAVHAHTDRAGFRALAAALFDPQPATD